MAEGNADLNLIRSPSKAPILEVNCLEKGGQCLMSPSLNLACFCPFLPGNAKRNKTWFLPLKMGPISKKKNTKNSAYQNR